MTVHVYRTMGYTVKTNMTCIQTFDSDCSKSIHQELSQERKTKTVHDERVEKRVCEIELRGAHLKLVYYNGKQVLLCIQHVECHYSPVCEERRRTH